MAVHPVLAGKERIDRCGQTVLAILTGYATTFRTTGSLCCNRALSHHGFCADIHQHATEQRLSPHRHSTQACLPRLHCPAHGRIRRPTSVPHCCIPPGSILQDDDVDALRKLATHQKTALVVVGATTTQHPNLPVLTHQAFLSRLGGPVSALLPLEPTYPGHLAALGRNALPVGLTGASDNLFEEYVHAGLQFLFHERVHRYGQERRFEALPDGLVPGKHAPLMLYDAKAAGDGYDVTSTTIRQFSDYVNNFHERYEHYTGRLYCFLAVSGEFRSPATLQGRADELYATCHVPLRFITANELGAVVRLFAERPAFREVIDWKKIFAKHLITAADVTKYLEARRKDGVIAVP